jgi:hypothetical protein
MKRFLMFLMAVAFVVAMPACTEDDNSGVSSAPHAIKVNGGTSSVMVDDAGDDDIRNDVYADGTSASRGQTVKIQENVPADKMFIRWKVLRGGVRITQNTMNQYTFAMPAWDVEVEAIFGNGVYLDKGTANISSVATYEPNGRLYKAAQGDVVTLTPDAEEAEAQRALGKEFAYWASMPMPEEPTEPVDPEAPIVPVEPIDPLTLPRFETTKNQDGLETFVMPAEDVALMAVYSDINVFDKITDARFKEICLAYDVNTDDFLSLDEAKAVTTMDVSYKQLDQPDAPVQIASLAGIEYFVNLTELRCTDNLLEALDVSKLTKLKVLDCRNNYIKELNLVANNALTNVNCSNNRLTALSMSTTGTTRTLLNMDCSQNLLTALNFSGQNRMQTLYCQNNQLSTLNVSGCSVLATLNCSFNRLLTVDVATCLALKKLWCDNNALAQLNVTQNIQLTDLKCNNNMIEKNGLNVGGVTALQTLNCSSNNITQLSLNTNANLTSLLCSNNKLTELNLASNTNLATLYCENNLITALDLTTNTLLTSPYTDPNVVITR